MRCLMGCDVMQGDRPDDVFGVRINELLILPVPVVLGGVSSGMPGVFTGLASGAATSTANVADVVGTDAEYEERIAEYLGRSGWDRRLPANQRQDAARRIREATQRAAAGHQAGTILEIRERGVQPRPLLRTCLGEGPRVRPARVDSEPL